MLPLKGQFIYIYIQKEIKTQIINVFNKLPTCTKSGSCLFVMSSCFSWSFSVLNRLSSGPQILHIKGNSSKCCLRYPHENFLTIMPDKLNKSSRNEIERFWKVQNEFVNQYFLLICLMFELSHLN